MMNIVKFFAGLCIAAAFMTGCKSDSVKPEEITTLLSNVKMYHCKDAELAKRSDSLWNEVADHMDKLLDKGMDPEVRQRLIDIKNTMIIRRFKIYDNFPDTVKHMLAMVDTFDSHLVKDLKMNSAMLDSMESKKLSFLKKMEGDKAQAEQFEKKYKEAIESACK